jgi:hypothetical protein
MNYVKYNGKKLPIYNTPISNAEIQHLRENHDTFLIKDVRSGTIKLINNPYEIQRFRIDFGFKPAIYTTALVLVIYNFLSFKKKVKRGIKKNWVSGVDMETFFKEMNYQEKQKPIEV